MAAQADLLGVFEREQAVARLDALHEGIPVRRCVDEVNAGLVQRDGVHGREDADVVHVGLGRATVAVAVHGEPVHDVDVEHVSLHVVDDGFARLRHGREERILVPAPHASARAAGMDVRLALCGGDADGDVLDRAAEAGHGVPLEVGEHHDVAVVRKVRAHVVLRKVGAALDRKGQGPFRIQDVHVRDGGISAVLRELEVIGGVGPLPAIGRVALHDRAVDGRNEVLDELGPQVVAPGLARADLHRHVFCGQDGAQGFVDGQKSLGADVRRPVDDRVLFRLLRRGGRRLLRGRRRGICRRASQQKAREQGGGEANGQLLLHVLHGFPPPILRRPPR